MALLSMRFYGYLLPRTCLEKYFNLLHGHFGTMGFQTAAEDRRIRHGYLQQGQIWCFIFPSLLLLPCTLLIRQKLGLASYQRFTVAGWQRRVAGCQIFYALCAYTCIYFIIRNMGVAAARGRGRDDPTG
ncbi:hypothetical protein SUGI_0722660 [Cryptomeria japonica]|nr:hypothetical protein SUGI_0722660 [Cryptomeria japonica]